MPTITETVGEIALNQPSSIRVFERFGIDYCCGGRKPLAVACSEQDVEIDAVLDALAQAAVEPSPDQTDWSRASLADLSQHIVSKHHEYVKMEAPRLDQLARKVAGVHGANHPELANIQSGFEALYAELMQHLMKEEQILFPYIEQLERARAGSGPVPHGCFGTVQGPINMMMYEHDSAGTIFAEMRQLSNNYTLPPDACTSYKALYSGIQEFEQDLHQHIHLENNILFPRAIELENSTR